MVENERSPSTNGETKSMANDTPLPAPSPTLGVSCESCIYFVPPPQGDVGNCHAGPPQAFILSGPPARLDPSQQPTIQLRAAWPPVGRNDWCGKHPLFGINIEANLAVPLDARLAAEAEGSG